ncbi:sensor histidine kinase [Mycolicibacterium frederiksbergense]|nr:GAF domain-containing sensor histidine kinase [Mycolicibacterium frederiksbergense]
MHEQLDELVAARDQMEMLLGVVTDIASDLDLQATLHRIVGAAMRLTGARYGAVGVRASDGGLSAFLHQGIGADLVAQMDGQLPAGKGLLGLVLDRTDPLRVDDLSGHIAAVGFPDHHPPMRAFLGVPIVIRGEVYGALYVTHDQPEHTFTEFDEAAAQALASAAAVAVDNARLYERVRAVAQWTNASREITTALLTGINSQLESLQLIAELTRELTDAEQAIVLVPSEPDKSADDNDTLTVFAAAGDHADDVIGQHVPIADSTSGRVFRSGTAINTETFLYPIAAFTDVGQRPVIVVPLRASDAVIGVLAIARGADQPSFDDHQLALMDDFAHHAALALTLARASEQARQLTVLADRERIARDLHDHVIQRLFLCGMELQGTIARTRSPAVIERLARTVDDLQSIVDEIRTAIFDLQSPAAAAMNFRQRIQAAVASLTDDANLATTLHMGGPMIVVDSELADHAEAVVIEAVSNALRHSGASRLTVDVTVSDQLTIDVVDDGCGIPADNQRHSGIANLCHRAQQTGGTCEITSPPGGGTHVHWAAPLRSQ